MKKLTLYTILLLLSTISIAQEAHFITESPGRNLNENNDYLLVQETSNTWDFWESHWENAWNTTYTYDESNNLIEKLEKWTDGSESQGRRTYYYDEYQRLVLQVHQRWDTTHWTNIDKQEYFYDANGNLEEERGYMWFMDNEWHKIEKFIHSYDGNNNRIYTLKQNFCNGSSWENEENYTYAYDGNNNLIESVSQDWDGSAWVNNGKTSFFYDENNNAYEIWGYSWYESEWFLYYKNFSTFDDNNNLLTSLVKNWNWDISDWENQHKWTYTYDQHNNQVKSLSQTWFDDEGAEYWLNQRKSTYYYLPAKNERFVAKHHSINKTINDFQITEDEINIEPSREELTLIGIEVSLDSVLHTSDSDLEFNLSHNDIEVDFIIQAGGEGDNFIGTLLTDSGIDSISSGVAPFPGFYKPENPLSAFLETDPAGTWTLSIYDGVEGNTGTLQAWGLNLIYALSSGIDDGISHHTELLIYPNPAVSVVSLQSAVFSRKLLGQQPTVLTIYDLNGKKLIEKHIPAGSETVQLDVSGLTNGIYFCRIKSKIGIISKKLIIQ